MRLSRILQRDLPVDPEITAVTSDSRKAGPGVLFAALPGVARDGADFAPQAVAAGARARRTRA
jgi:UDP-N-acetylmuramoyl-L-alanyl-D-glutamate--2,6-diaminopimelate ligase